MKYFRLIPADQPHENTIFFRFQNPDKAMEIQFTGGAPLWATGMGKRVPRDMYRDFYCPACWKIDEFKALARGLGPETRIKAETDFVRCFDGPLCCSARAADVIRESKAWGVDIIPLPGDPHYFLLWPSPMMKTDTKKCMLWLDERCKQCDRVKSTLGCPSPSAMDLPDRHPIMIGPDIWSETVVGRTTNLFVDEPMRRIIRSAHLTGIFQLQKCLDAPPPWLDKWKASGGKYMEPAKILKSIKQRHRRRSKEPEPEWKKQLFESTKSNPSFIYGNLVLCADETVVKDIELMLADRQYEYIHDVLRAALKTAKG